MANILQKKWFRIIEQAIVVALLGYILLLLTFILNALFQLAIDSVAKIFITEDINMIVDWYPPLKYFAFLLIIGITSYYIFKSKLSTLFKATYLTVPTALVLVTEGIFLYNWPLVVYLLGFISSVSALYYLYKTKQPWIYYYSISLIAITLAIFTLTGGEI
ncbi:MAG: hypothetical protein V1898_03850 [Patescibacteria group bacterium]